MKTQKVSFSVLTQVIGSARLGLRASFILALLNAGAVSADTHYVWLNSPDPRAPYDGWSTAAHTIQAAVDAAAPGDTVRVTNGFYAAGGRPVYGTMTNRVAVTTPITLVSVNGPAVTFIQGAQPIGASAIRCVYLASGATLSGFTLTNGATHGDGDWAKEQSGGGVWCEREATVSNCVVTGSSANYGGGACSGTLKNCTVWGNTASQYGGGAYACLLTNCTVSNNWAALDGGGVCSCIMDHGTLVGNTASQDGGGADSSFLGDCAVVDNWASSYGGGAASSTLTNCTLTDNFASQ